MLLKPSDKNNGNTDKKKVEHDIFKCFRKHNQTQILLTITLVTSSTSNC